MDVDVDAVLLNELSIMANIGPDCWNRSRPQPILATITNFIGIASTGAGSSDDVNDCLDYSILGKEVISFCSRKEVQNGELREVQFQGLIGMADSLAQFILEKYAPKGLIIGVKIGLEAPKASLRAEATVVELTRYDSKLLAMPKTSDSISFRGIPIAIVIGVNPAERECKQRVILHITFHLQDGFSLPVDFNGKLSKVVEAMEVCSPKTLEKFVTDCAKTVYSIVGVSGIDAVTVEAEKPSAVVLGRSSAVRIKRRRSWFFL